MMDIKSTQKRNAGTLDQEIAQSNWLKPKYMSERDTSELEKIRTTQRMLDQHLAEGIAAPELHALDSAWMNAGRTNLEAKVKCRHLRHVLSTRFRERGDEKLPVIQPCEHTLIARRLLRDVKSRLARGEGTQELRSEERLLRWTLIALHNEGVVNVLEARLKELAAQVRNTLHVSEMGLPDFYMLSLMGVVDVYSVGMARLFDDD